MRAMVEFVVSGQVPPKKDGANSMWAKRSEIPRIIALRQAALRALQGAPPFESGIALTLEVHVPAPQLVPIGDLDNFITGVCDGLMSANPRCKRDPAWNVPEVASVGPNATIAIRDDSQITSISARKLTSASGDHWYRVILEGER